MRSRSVLQVVVGAGAVALLASSASAKEMQWASSLSEAMQTAKGNGALVMLDFYTDW